MERANLAELTSKWRKGDATDEEPDFRPNPIEMDFEDNFGGGLGEYFGGFHGGDDNNSSDSPSSDSYSSISHTSRQRRIRSASPPTPTRNYNLCVQKWVNYYDGSSSRRRRKINPVSIMHILVFY